MSPRRPRRRPFRPAHLIPILLKTQQTMMMFFWTDVSGRLLEKRSVKKPSSRLGVSAFFRFSRQSDFHFSLFGSHANDTRECRISTSIII
ncbi:hypothetical protein CSUI_002427 [Cystoisospora suis]|uniref:Uncharacterized protein n=1 Tax=Cystoisospora suis TaxID=483139 RepID=A0A2C6KI60_9APIC|nr:hypothetical protein CSUI_002427 [Cystoisospora suis]